MTGCGYVKVQAGVAANAGVTGKLPSVALIPISRRT
jgi:hypothetical protein